MNSFINRLKKNCYLLYTVFFVLVSLIVFSYFYLNNKTFISHGDGWMQHYKSLYYYSRYLRNVFKTIFINHSFNIPNWDFNIGEGSDILGALHYYCVGDPFAFLGVFVPEKLMYAFYDFVVISKIYIAGLVFVTLCLYIGKKDYYAIISGSLIYVFCYWVMLNVSKHIFFLTPMIYFPLIILGVEKIINNDKPYLFTIAVFLCAASHIYFFYMTVLLVIIYVIIRLLCLYGTDFVSILKVVYKLLINSIISLFMAAVILLPMVNVLLNNNRIGVDYANHFMYMRFYYERLFTVLLADDYPYWLCMGFASPVIISLMTTIRNFKNKPFVFFVNLMAFIMVCFPIFGRIFNGMGYIANRWSYALALVAAYTFVEQYDDFKKYKKFLLISVPLFILAGFVSAWSREIRVFVPVVICLLYLVVLMFNFKYQKQILLSLIILSIVFNGDHIYSEHGNDKRAITAINKDDAKNVVQSNEAYEIKKYILENKIEYFTRFSGFNLSDNVGMLNDISGTCYYFSMANPHIAEFRSKIGVTEYSAYRFYSLDSRGTLLTLGNVSLYTIPNDKDGIIPYGFSFKKQLPNYKLYVNDYALPFGYTYSKAISYDKWNSLNAVEKEAALLDAVVLENGNDTLDIDIKKIDINYSPDENVVIDGNNIIVKEKDSTIRLKIDGLSNCENYFIVQGMSYWDGNSYYDESQTDVEISVIANNTSIIEYHTNDYSFYNARKDFAAYLGYSDSPINEVILSFSEPGTYSFSEMSFICRPVERYAEYIKKLSEETLDNLVFGVDSLSGSINLSQDKYLLLSIPYSKGWKAYADGKPIDLLRANECYSALKLEKGNHQIELKYETPYLKVGAIVSAISIIVYSLYFIRNCRRRNEE